MNKRHKSLYLSSLHPSGACGDMKHCVNLSEGPTHFEGYSCHLYVQVKPRHGKVHNVSHAVRETGKGLNPGSLAEPVPHLLSFLT